VRLPGHERIGQETLVERLLIPLLIGGNVFRPEDVRSDS
jgi:hypothetical protein